MEPKTIEKSILDTIKYFNIFDFPLTALEIYKFLFSKEKFSYEDIFFEIKNSEFLKNNLDKKDGFYCLKGKSDIIDKRRVKYILSYDKFKKAKKFVNFISNFSCFKAIGVVNTLSQENVRNESDIDLFIITKKGTIWIARFLSVIFTKISNLRPTEEDTKDKICLSFFISEDSLSIENMRKGDNDVYLKYWINSIVPLYDPKKYFVNFFDENKFSRENIENSFIFNTNKIRKVDNNFRKRVFRKFSNIVNSKFLENFLHKIQFKIFPEKIKNLMNKNGNDVFISENIIKLHTNDRRDKYNNAFIESLTK